MAGGVCPTPMKWRPWINSTLLTGDLSEAVARLKQEAGDLMVIGSIRLVHYLAQHNMIDRYILQIAPLVLGSGLRLFPEGTPARLRLVQSRITTTGVIIASYEPAESFESADSRAEPEKAAVA